MTFTIPNRSTAVNQNQTLWFQADVDALAAGIAGNGVRAGCAVTWTSGNDLAVASGSVSINGSTVNVTGTPLTVFQANGSMHRIDLVVVDTTGTVSLVRGQSVSLTPIAPDIPANSVLLAEVFVPAGSIALDATRVVDKRVFVSSSTGASTGITQLTGDVLAGPGSGSQVATLSTTAVTAGTYGSATQIPQFTVDAKGRLTAAQNVSIAYGFNADLLTSAKVGGKTYSQKTEYTSLSTSATVTLLDTTSTTAAGYVDSVFLALQGASTVVRDQSLVKVYIDGSTAADISVRADQLAGAVYFDSAGTVQAFTAKYIGCNTATNSKAYFFNLPIPFATSIKMTVTNASPSVAGTVWSVVSYKTGIANTWSRTRRLRIDSGTGDAAPDSVVTFTDVAGKGRYAGLWLLVDGFPGSNTPRLAALEGNIKIYIDGDVTPTYESSGTEDYFLQGFYFGNSQTPTNSPLVGKAWQDANSISGYRFHTEDPWTFDTHLKITWNAGDTSQVSFTGNVRYYYTVWYYTES